MTVLYRYGRDGRTRFARTGRVIADTADGVTLWTAAGSPQIESLLADGRPLRSVPVADRFALPRIRRETTWRGPGIVQFAPTAGEFSISWFFTDQGDFEGWYVNLESQPVRHDHFIDSTDRALDVWITPDRIPHWKDEDEFAHLTDRPGRWTTTEATAIRATATALVSRAAAAEFPFDGRWTDYRPDPTWPPLTLPPNWDDPHLATP
ncbi:DUF402 domain-containing protein [Paractinoplanes aksuensis]|uniref:DUF402 domain-containing protein n=1 Tax=Paractinoplanes aksuensis TaxID=2939490 RepID=UPI0027E2FFF2|nr:DUF402 domain-containing protein [Actinoplanes aksuensis]